MNDISKNAADENILTEAKVRRMKKAALIRLMGEMGIPYCRDFSAQDCIDAVLARIGPDDDMGE